MGLNILGQSSYFVIILAPNLHHEVHHGMDALVILVGQESGKHLLLEFAPNSF